MELIKVKYDQIVDYISKQKENPSEQFILIDRPSDAIIVSLSADSNKVVEPPHIDMKLKRTGGTIVACKDGIGVYQIVKLDFDNPIQNIKDMMALRVCVKDYLVSKGIKAEIKGNDIIVDHFFKVCGCHYQSLAKGYGLIGMHISINVDLDLIKKYCDKPMIKKPKGLSEYGITRAELIEEIEKFVANK